MVIPPFCPGANVEIIVDGQPLPEYDDKSEAPSPPNTITKYIEAQTGALFAVRVRFTDDFAFPIGDIEAEVMLDQQLSDRTLIFAENMFGEGVTIAGRAVALSPWTNATQNFRFTSLNIGGCSSRRLL